MYNVAELLMTHHKENAVDYTQKYGLTLQITESDCIAEWGID